jgi:sec-independent protein translocase protein TatB
MQMFGIGLPELMLILVLAVLLVGPDRMPALAADLARWIRRTRAYAQHLMTDFNDVMGDLEKEVGASREDFKEIASVVGLHTRDFTNELNKVATQIEQAGDAANQEQPAVPAYSAAQANGDSAANGNGDSAPAAESAPSANGTESAEEKPWYVPERTTRRRSE